MTLAAGTRLGAYKVLALLGAGGMSVCDYARVPGAAAALGWCAEARRVKLSRGITVSSRRGWGPAASEKKLTPSPCR